MTETYEKLLHGLRAAFNSGRTKSIEYRKNQLRAFLRLLDENVEPICDALKKDLRRSRFEAVLYDISAVKAEILCTLENLDKWAAPEKPEKSPTTLFDDLVIYNDPLGVVLVIGAWNYPVQITLSPVVGAIAGGNCVVIKPSELASATASLLDVLIPRYLDNDCYKVILGGPAEMTVLLQNRFDHIFYTGSTNVGKIIYEAAAKHLTPVTLELGGKSPVFMDNTVDMKIATRRLLWGKLMNLGQTCVAPDYILCSKEVEKKFLDEVPKVLGEWFGNDPIKTEDLARIININHFNRLKGLIDPEKVAVGGELVESELYVAPTILSGVKKSDKVMADEIFGPILPIINVTSTEEAIEFINSRPKPLALYVFSTEKTVQDAFAFRTSSGGLVMNDVVMHLTVDTLPFGGVGHSGMGNYHGKFSFDTFVHKKACMKRSYNGILEKLGSLRYPPQTEEKMKKLLDLTKRRKIPISMSFLMYLGVFLLGAFASYLIMAIV